MQHHSHRIWSSAGRALALSLLLAAGAGAQAAEDFLEQGRVYAIQPRAFRMNQEFSLSAAFLPLDAFYKSFAVSGHYVLHFSDLWAWEAVHLSFAKYMAIDTGLKKQMMDDWDVSPTDTPKVDYLLDTNLMIKPLYGKMAVLNSRIIFMETYFLLGLGTIKYETAFFPAANVGAGMRVYLTSTISLRSEVRYYASFGEGFDSVLYFGLSFCYNAFAEDKPAAKRQ
jgi:outer membrane beta-barrel protein